MAATTVFALPEILENIILHLPLRNILIAKRTCKTFQVTINSSIWIRRALFLEPNSETRASLRRLDESDRSHAGIWRDQKGHPIAPLLNPFLAVENDQLFEQLRCRNWYHENVNGLYLGQNETFTIGPATRDDRTLNFEAECEDKSDLIKALHESKAIFKRMTITAPPISKLAIEAAVLRPRSEDGFCIEDLLDCALALSGVDEFENDFELEGFADCRVLANTVDEIHGWDMLRIFLLDEAQLDNEGLLLND